MYGKSLHPFITEIMETNSDIVGLELKNDKHGSTFIFGMYLPSDCKIDNYRQEFNCVDDLYTHYSNYGNVILAGDFNASCINKNNEFTNTLKSKELKSFIDRHGINHPFTDTYKHLLKGSEFSFMTKQTMLDYILVNDKLIRQLESY